MSFEGRFLILPVHFFLKIKPIVKNLNFRNYCQHLQKILFIRMKIHKVIEFCALSFQSEYSLLSIRKPRE